MGQINLRFLVQACHQFLEYGSSLVSIQQGILKFFADPTAFVGLALLDKLKWVIFPRIIGILECSFQRKSRAERTFNIQHFWYPIL